MGPQYKFFISVFGLFLAILIDLVRMFEEDGWTGRWTALKVNSKTPRRCSFSTFLDPSIFEDLGCTSVGVKRVQWETLVQQVSIEFLWMYVWSCEQLTDLFSRKNIAWKTVTKTTLKHWQKGSQINWQLSDCLKLYVSEWKLCCANVEKYVHVQAR